MLKLNVDASYYACAKAFNIGMVVRDHAGTFIEGRCMALMYSGTRVEVECMRVREALSWVKSISDERVIIETDSLLVVHALYGKSENLLALGHVIEQCNGILKDLPGVVVSHVRKQANKVAHDLAKIPYLLNCLNVFMSPFTHLLETIYVILQINGRNFTLKKINKKISMCC